jgi:hypothetical protein
MTFFLQVSGASRLRLRLGVRVALVMHICAFSPGAVRQSLKHVEGFFPGWVTMMWA